MKGWVLPASAMLHLALIAALLPWPAGRAGGTAEAPPIEVELVQQPDATQGTPVVAPTVEAASVPPSQQSTFPEKDTAPVPVGSPAPASEPASAAVNLGDAEETRDGMDVTGRGVVPPSPDSAFRNQPPAYPIEAARQHAQGTVTLLIHVSAQGRPQEVVIANSSGAASLDRAARNAVRRWRFTPAQIQGTPVPFDYSLDIRFILGDKQ
jgi:protein TonB